VETNASGLATHAPAVERFLAQEREMIRRKRDMQLERSQLKREQEEP